MTGVGLGQYTSHKDLEDMKWTDFGELERDDFDALVETMKPAHKGAFWGLLRKAREQKTESKGPSFLTGGLGWLVGGFSCWCG